MFGVLFSIWFVNGSCLSEHQQFTGIYGVSGHFDQTYGISKCYIWLKWDI